MHCDANGLKLAIEDALKDMADEGADGFDYKIGEVRGMNLRIVAEPEDGGVIVTSHGPMNFTAVLETAM